MYREVLITLSSYILLSSAQQCPGPDPTQPDVTSNCILVPGCNFVENGTLTPIATQCSNQLSDAACVELFPCPVGLPPGPVRNCDFNAAGTNDPTTYPYVRSPSCISPNVQSVALQCAKQCGMCCQSPEYSCDNDNTSPINCDLNKNKCQDSAWMNIMSQFVQSNKFILDCPKTCGLCTTGTCSDKTAGCNTMTALCKNVEWQGFMSTNCARTCDICNATSTSTSSNSSCSDIAANCAQNINLCSDSVYRTLMLQECCATCSGTSLSSVSAIRSSCSDSSTSCSIWLRNGFCSSRFYTANQKRQYCARTCNLC